MNPNEIPSEPVEEKEPRTPWQRHLRTYIGFALTGLLVFWLIQPLRSSVSPSASCS